MGVLLAVLGSPTVSSASIVNGTQGLPGLGTVLGGILGGIGGGFAGGYLGAKADEVADGAINNSIRSVPGLSTAIGLLPAVLAGAGGSGGAGRQVGELTEGNSMLGGEVAGAADGEAAGQMAGRGVEGGLPEGNVGNVTGSTRGGRAPNITGQAGQDYIAQQHPDWEPQPRLQSGRRPDFRNPSTGDYVESRNRYPKVYRTKQLADTGAEIVAQGRRYEVWIPSNSEPSQPLLDDPNIVVKKNLPPR